jgi:hypothetical protein
MGLSGGGTASCVASTICRGVIPGRYTRFIVRQYTSFLFSGRLLAACFQTVRSHLCLFPLTAQHLLFLARLGEAGLARALDLGVVKALLAADASLAEPHRPRGHADAATKGVPARVAALLDAAADER